MRNNTRVDPGRIMAAVSPPLDLTQVLIRLIDRGAAVLTAMSYAAAVVGTAYCVSLAIGHLAGQSTSLLVTYLTDTGSGITVTISIGTGVLGATYGVWQRHLHHKTVAYFGPRLAAYEMRLDPERSTSGLPPRGTTHPQDR